MSQKRKRLTMKEKVEVVKLSEKEKLSVRILADKFGIGKTQVGDILRKKAEILKSWAENGNQESKRAFPKTEGLAVDSVTYDWFCQARAKNIPLSGTVIRDKALEIAKGLGFEEFKASGGWLDKFKARHNISYKCISGESSTVPTDVVSDWKPKLIDLCKDYEEKNIFNCDETGLFYRALPSKTMAFKGERCSCGKIAKERLTVMLCVNMLGEFEKPLIIGKSKKPRCFKGVDINSLDVDYRANKKSWMTGDLMIEWLGAFDRRMQRQKRKVILFLDNASSHPDATLENVKLVFFPPNTTSICQPLDQGIIKCFKNFYRQFVVRRLLVNMDNVESASALAGSVTVLDATLWIVAAIKKIGPATVRICFTKAGFIPITAATTEDSGATVDDPALQEFLRSYEEYASIDEALTTKNQSIEISDLIACRTEVETGNQTTEVTESDDDDVVTTYNLFTNKDAMESVKNLRNYFLQKNDVTGLKMSSELEIHLESKVAHECRKQTTILDYFA